MKFYSKPVIHSASSTPVYSVQHRARCGGVGARTVMIM